MIAPCATAPREYPLAAPPVGHTTMASAVLADPCPLNVFRGMFECRWLEVRDGDVDYDIITYPDGSQLLWSDMELQPIYGPLPPSRAPYAASQRTGAIPGTGPGLATLYHATDPLLGWCAECGWEWEPDLSQPIADEVASRLLIDRAGTPLDHCARCGAGSSARTGPRVWAEQLYRELDGDLLGLRHSRSQDLPECVIAAFEAGKISVDELTWWRATARQRWEELADNPRARWLDDIHRAAYDHVDHHAPLAEMGEHVQGHRPETCPACQRYRAAVGCGQTIEQLQADVVAAVERRASC